jgi:hypothetical protein
MTSDRAPSLRKQLVEARANIIEQLYQLRSPASEGLLPGIRAPDNRGIIAELEGELREIDALLDGKEASDA